MKACCSGCSVSPRARPSMVVTCAPSFITARVRHELIRLPSTRTVQAPHWPWSQPFLVPVRSRCRRSRSSSVVHGATVSLCSTPLTCSVIAILAGVGNRSACLRAAGNRCAIDFLAVVRALAWQMPTRTSGRTRGPSLDRYVSTETNRSCSAEARCKAAHGGCCLGPRTHNRGSRVQERCRIMLI